MKKLACSLLITFSLLPAFAQKIEADRISENILVLNEDYNRCVAVLTNKGVVLIDTRMEKEKMLEMKQLIKQEFKTDSIIYIINTHGCPEHVLGNSFLPNTPAIMNSNFFNRKKIYEHQKAYIDSLENECLHSNDTSIQNSCCKQFEQSKTWRPYCVKALKVEPDITYSEKMNLYFDNLTIQLVLTGLGHGYSTFIYIPEEKFLHSSTFGNRLKLPQITIPPFMDSAAFLPYQISVLKDFITVSDSIEYVVPGHGDYYSSDELKQKLNYYVNMYKLAKNLADTETDLEAFKTKFTLETIIPEFKPADDIKEKELETHRKNIDWLCNYFN